MRNIFLKKTYTKFIWTLFSESKLTISLDQNSEILCGLLLLYVQIEVYQNLLLPHNFFFFFKKVWNQNQCTFFYFCMIFPLREQCPNAEFLWPVFSCIRTECGYLHHKSPYSVRIQGNTDQKKFRIWAHFTECSEISCPTLYSIY